MGSSGAVGELVPQAQFEEGDRFEVSFAWEQSDALLIRLPAELADEEHPVDRLEDASGRRLDLTRTSDPSLLRVRGMPPHKADVESAWLEYRGPGWYSLILDPSRRANGNLAADLPAIEFDPADINLLHDLRRRASPPQFELGLRAARLAIQPGFDELICLPMVRDMEVLEHQTRAARTVLRRMRARAMLCDEVGLGKTIEAGLVLSELLMRGLVRSVLVLTPPSLIEQWQGEMRRKFAIELTAHDDPALRDRGGLAGCQRVIASIHTAKREPHRSALLSRTWDMVIIDEAHHLRNRATQAWKLTSEIRKQFILLLTATPVQNNLDELFNLVTLLEPGLLSTSKDFQRRFVDRSDKLTPKNVDELHGLLAEVMVRNRRDTVGLQFTRRWAHTHRVLPSASERELYDRVSGFIRDHLAAPPTAQPPEKKAGLSRMTLVMLQMALGSSSPAAASMLRNLAESRATPAPLRSTVADLATAADDHPHGAKVDRLLRLVDEFGDKLVVFTQFRATQEMLLRQLSDAGHETAVFHGGLPRLEKERAVEQFRRTARVLLATDSGSEGRNLQFTHGVCNFDLPWNPMRIEQRIGRLSRIGQSHDVHVFNLVAAGTVEAAVLHLLEAKLAMFELVIGEIDMILGNLDEEREFPDMLADEWAQSASADEFAARMEVLGTRLLAAKAAYFRQRTQDDKLFGNRFAPEG